MDMKPAQLTMTHPTGRYPVIVGWDLLPRLAELADLHGPLTLITDSNVGPLYAQTCGPVEGLVTLPAGEQYKTLDSVKHIYDELIAAGIDRQGTLVALGGGVIGDAAGFAAATYMRGINFIQCPTTVLAMVDASIGGKTGVDLPQGKNLVGAFKQPLAVIADLATLRTLPPQEFAAGMAEVVKHGLISAPHILARLEQGTWSAASVMATPADLQSLITEAIQVKRDVVEEDPFEKGRRAVLNLGHTFGHAIEKVSQYRIRHGEGVAMGLVAAIHLSIVLGHCSPELQPRVEELLRRLQLPYRIPASLSPELLYQAMGSDKKKKAGQLRFVLIRAVADVFLARDVPRAAVLSTLKSLGAKS